VRGILSRAFSQIGAGILLGSIPGVALILFDSEIAANHGEWAALWAVLAVATFIVGVAAVSCLGPVRRALRVQPFEALRTEG
jgi:ABC-type lipoprotein release transport system permease subunit